MKRPPRNNRSGAQPGSSIDSARKQALMRRTRLAAIVIAVTMLAWIGAQVLGGQLNLAPHFAFLFDLAAIAAFLWTMIVPFQIRRARRANEEQ